MSVIEIWSLLRNSAGISKKTLTNRNAWNYSIAMHSVFDMAKLGQGAEE
jgi:hypothetical protein